MGSQKKIGENIKKARIKANLTQVEVANKVEMNVNYYARIERGEVRASFDTLERIFKVLKVKSSDILPF
jgi:transcriptional regulator with XRE-family HTH domain